MSVLPFILVVLLCGFASHSGAAGYDRVPDGDVRSVAEEGKPRLKRGVHWYRRPSSPTDLEQEKLAYEYYRDKDLRKAANAYQALVYAWPDSPRAAVAQLNLANIQRKRGKVEAAFDEYQYLVDNYPGRFEYKQVLDAQFQIAEQVMSQKVGRVFFLGGFPAPERALPMFEKVIRNAPSGDWAAESQFLIGRIHEMNQEDEEAVAAYELAQSRYFGTRWAESAAFRETCCLYRLSEERRNDENALNAARAALSAFIRSYPASPDAAAAETHLRTLNTRLATLAFEKAEFYERVARRPEVAERMYGEFAASYPRSPLAETARQRQAELKGRKP